MILEINESMIIASFWMNILIFAIYSVLSVTIILCFKIKIVKTLIGCAALYELLFLVRMIDNICKMYSHNTFTENLFKLFTDIMAFLIWIICIKLILEVARVKIILDSGSQVDYNKRVRRHDKISIFLYSFFFLILAIYTCGNIIRQFELVSSETSYNVIVYVSLGFLLPFAIVLHIWYNILFYSLTKRHIKKCKDIGKPVNWFGYLHIVAIAILDVEVIPRGAGEFVYAI